MKLREKGDVIRIKLPKTSEFVTPIVLRGNFGSPCIFRAGFCHSFIYSKFGLWIFLICSSNSLIDLNLDSQSLQL
jgi:hypothetical protein